MKNTSPKYFFLPSIADLIFIVFFVLGCTRYGQSFLRDADTGYHIRTGDFILKNLSIPKFDIFSYHTPAIAWVTHEWLSEVLMSVAHYFLGLTGVVVLFAGLVALIYRTLFNALRRQASILVSLFLICCVVSTSSLHWLARPHIFSLLLTVCWCWILDEFEYHNNNYLYLLPILMVFWVNLHGSFITGLIILSIYIVGNWFNKHTKDKARKLIPFLFFSILATLFNPQGFYILAFPLQVISNSLVMDNVVEFLSPNFHRLIIFEYFLYITIAILAFSKKPLNLIEAMLAIFFIKLSLYSVRYVTLFAIIIAPILARQMEFMIANSTGTWAKLINDHSSNLYNFDKKTIKLWRLATIFVVLLLVNAGFIHHNFSPKRVPIAAIEFAQKENITGNMFNDDEFGDYIIYSHWPKIRVCFDGRSDMYGAAGLLKDYLEVINVGPNWRAVLDKYQINWVIISPKRTFSLLLSEARDWKLVYSDDVANIFVRNSEGNSDLIQKTSRNFKK